jgi:phospholipase/carboxylesterase
MNEAIDLSYDYWRPDLPTPAGAPVRVLILMHGRGASRKDFAPLQKRLPRAWHVVVPDAPHPGLQWDYGSGFAWYRFLGEDRPDGASLAVSLASLDALAARLPAIVGAEPTHVVVGGFSQGGTMGHAYALTRPGAARGVLNFSGFLPSTIALSPEAIRDTRFFWGHGLQDPSIPFPLAAKGRAALRAAGAELEARDYAIGHWIDPDELRDASIWLSAF